MNNNLYDQVLDLQNVNDIRTIVLWLQENINEIQEDANNREEPLQHNAALVAIVCKLAALCDASDKKQQDAIEFCRFAKKAPPIA